MSGSKSVRRSGMFMVSTEKQYGKTTRALEEMITRLGPSSDIIVTTFEAHKLNEQLTSQAQVIERLRASEERLAGLLRELLRISDMNWRRDDYASEARNAAREAIAEREKNETKR